MVSIRIMIGGAIINALAFSGTNFLFSSLSKESIDKEQKRHDKAIEDMQRAQIEWTKKRQEQLNYINNEIMKEYKAEKRFTNINAAVQQYFLVTIRQLEPLPPKPVLPDFYAPSEDHHNREITHICGIKGCGGAGWPPPTNNFRKTSVTPTNYISSEREFIGESESSKILGKYFGFAIL